MRAFRAHPRAICGLSMVSDSSVPLASRHAAPDYDPRIIKEESRTTSMKPENGDANPPRCAGTEIRGAPHRARKDTLHVRIGDCEGRWNAASHCTCRKYLGVVRTSIKERNLTLLNFEKPWKPI